MSSKDNTTRASTELQHWESFKKMQAEAELHQLRTSDSLSTLANQAASSHYTWQNSHPEYYRPLSIGSDGWNTGGGTWATVNSSDDPETILHSMFVLAKHIKNPEQARALLQIAKSAADSLKSDRERLTIYEAVIENLIDGLKDVEP